jgi:hypothetical protein
MASVFRCFGGFPHSLDDQPDAREGQVGRLGVAESGAQSQRAPLHCRYRLFNRPARGDLSGSAARETVPRMPLPVEANDRWVGHPK